MREGSDYLMPTIALNDRKITSLKPAAARVDYFDRALPGFGVRVTPTGHKSFVLLYRVNRKFQRLTLGVYPTLGLAKARKIARDTLEKASIGRNPNAEREAARTQTFTALAERYLERHAKRHKRSWRGDASRIRRVLDPTFGAMPVAMIRRVQIKTLLEDIAARGARVEANRTLALIRKMLNYALEEDWIEANPAAKLPRPGGKEQSRTRVLTAAELRAVWTHLQQPAPETLPALERRHWRLARAALLLRLLTAQRGQEVINLRWQDIDDTTWTIPAAFSKNKLPHRVPLTADALAVLQALKDEGVAGDDVIFAGVRGPRQRRGVLDDLGIADVRPHDFRRTAASTMASAGISRLVIAKVLNHIDRGVTAIYDRHSYDAEKRVALETWARKLDEIVTSKPEAAVVPFRKRARRRKQ
jgi:integrase